MATGTQLYRAHRKISSASSDTSSLVEAGYTANDLALCSSMDARGHLSMEDAIRLRALPLASLKQRGAPTLHVVTTENSEEVRRALQFACSCSIELSVAPLEILEEAILRAYLGSEEALARKVRALERSPAARERHTQVPHVLESVNGDAAQLLAALMQHAAVRGASDLHLCPTDNGAITKMRLDGELLVQTDTTYSRQVHDQMIARLKVLAGLDPSKRQVPHDGSFVFQVGNNPVSVRLSTVPSINGESAVIRFFTSKKIPALSEIGLESTTFLKLEELLGRKNGMILLTGPTGSGKSTTLYASLEEVRRKGRNVITVEDPVEIPIPGVVQIQVKEEQGLTYPIAIRSVLRHDPDCILIGEIRDSQSAHISIEASMTGHFTLSSVHARSALDVVPRLMGLGVAPIRIAEALILVVNQRLLPRLCVRCKVVDLAASRAFRATLYQRVGCPSCGHSGFCGRILASETLVTDDPCVKELLIRETSRVALLSRLPSSTFIPWSSSLQKHLLAGDISAIQFGRFLEDELGG